MNRPLIARLFAGATVLALNLVLTPAAQAALPTATTLAASGMSNTVATLNGTVNPGGLATTAWFEWGTAANNSQQTAPASVGSGSSPLAVSQTLPGLTPGLIYHYRVAASNALGWCAARMPALVRPPSG